MREPIRPPLGFNPPDAASRPPAGVAARGGKASVTGAADPRHDGPQLLKLEEVANFLRLHPRTIRRMVKSGRIPCVRIRRAIRFDQGDVFAWLQARKEG
jgi:excisionase family DNA binding protein